jgi:hypothetical protein
LLNLLEVYPEGLITRPSEDHHAGLSSCFHLFKPLRKVGSCFITCFECFDENLTLKFMSIHRMSMQLMVSLEVQALQLLPLKSDAR